jgi:hypothetical protein
MNKIPASLSPLHNYLFYCVIGGLMDTKVLRHSKNNLHADGCRLKVFLPEKDKTCAELEEQIKSSNKRSLVLSNDYQFV